MAVKKLFKESWNNDNLELLKSISLLKMEISAYKKERKSNWKIFKNKIQDDLDKLEQAIGATKAKRKSEKLIKSKPVYQIPDNYTRN